MASNGKARYLSEMYGLNQQPSGTITSPNILSTTLGWNITQATDRFPRAVAFYQSLGWTNTEILERTYFTMAYNDAVLYGDQVLFAHEAHDFEIRIPGGRYYYNSELRSGQNRNIGEGSRFNFGSGGTQLMLLGGANWKSIYGAQNNNITLGFVPWVYCGEANTSVFPLGFTGGTEWCHHFTVEDIAMNGQAPDGFRNASKVDIGVMYYNPGEQSGIFRCEFSDYNDFGLLISHAPADTYVNGLSGFRNKVGIIGQRGGALSNNVIVRLSGDFNPYHIFQFRGGSDVFGTGAYLPHAIASNPGGTCNLFGFKLEDSCGRTGYPGFTGTSSSIGKGNMLARVTGRTYFHVYGGTANTYIGKGAALVEIVDDFDEGFGGTPLDNSCVELNNVFTNRFGYYFHDWSGEKVFEANQLSTFDKPVSARWDAIDNSRNAFYHAKKTPTDVTASSAIFHGRQPFINDGEAVTFDYDIAPTHGYNPITGANYP